MVANYVCIKKLNFCIYQIQKEIQAYDLANRATLKVT